jgi:hypothetical protein
VAYIAGLIIAGLFFLSLHYFTELTKSQKTVVTAIVLGFIISAIAYNSYNATQREKMLKVVTAFNQGKTVECAGVDVNANNYTLSVGTFTFIGKENTPIYGQMISASDCQ